jgi:hypothetical protein
MLNKTEAQMIREAEMVLDNQSRVLDGKPYTIKLSFPCEITQVNANTIEIMVTNEGQAPFAPDFIANLQKRFGEIPAAQWLEEQVQRMNRELLLKQVR